MIKFNFLYNTNHKFYTIMYSVFIFLIAFVLFLFEMIVSLVFWKIIDSNILIYTCIMILPGIFTLIKRDTKRYHQFFYWSLINRILRRKQFYFFIEVLGTYTLLASIVSLLYLYLFYLLGNSDWINYSMIASLILLFLSTSTTILRQIFIHS